MCTIYNILLPYDAKFRWYIELTTWITVVMIYHRLLNVYYPIPMVFLTHLIYFMVLIGISNALVGWFHCYRFWDFVSLCFCQTWDSVLISRFWDEYCVWKYLYYMPNQIYFRIFNLQILISVYIIWEHLYGLLYLTSHTHILQRFMLHPIQ